MKKIFLLTSAFILMAFIAEAQIYMGKTCEISFFSDGPIEDIAAKNTTAKPILNTTTNDIAIKITIKGFDFDKELMEEHFNEKYLESDKYPYATFSGKINEKVDYKTDGVTKVTVTGKLNIHNVEQVRTIDGTITVKGGEIQLDCKFIVAMKDHKVEIPTLVAQNIAETVEVTIKSTLTEYVTKK